MNDVLARVAGLSLPTQAILAVSVLSLSYISITIILGVLGFIWGCLQSLTATVLSKRSQRQPATLAASIDMSALSTPSKDPQQPSVSLKSLIKSSKKGGKGASSGPDRHADSELFINGLRGHTDAVTGLAFSSDGRSLATACEDRTIRIFDLGTDISSTKNIPFRNFSLRYTPHDLAFGVTKNQLAVLTRGSVNAAGLCFVDISEKELNMITDLQNIFSGKATEGLCLRGSGGSGAAGNVPVILAAAKNPEMKVYLASPSLPTLSSKIDTAGFNNYWAAISNDGRFMAAATFASDVKIYEAEFDRTGNCTGVKKVMDLKGHKKKVTAVEFSPDSRQAVTASEDGTLKIWNINVRYKQQEDAKELAKEGLPCVNANVTRLAWGRGGHIAAVAGSDVYILAGGSGKMVDVISGAHAGEIHDILWSPTKVEGPQGAMAFFATAGSDGRVRLWRGPWNLF